jgi:hypothetical protein
MVLIMKTSRRKSVRFAPDGSMLSYSDSSEVHSLSQEVINDVWYQDSDYKEFVRQTRVAVDTAVRNGLSACITEPYGQNDMQTQELFNFWARCRNTRRGLERYVNAEYGKRRLLHRRKAIQAILYAEKRLQTENQSRYEGGAAILQIIASTLSASDVDFAIMMAVADRKTVLEHEPTAQRGRKIESIPLTDSKGIESKSRQRPRMHPTRCGGKASERQITPAA